MTLQYRKVLVEWLYNSNKLLVLVPYNPSDIMASLYTDV